MTILARYSGVCPDCGERWQPGDLIRADPEPINEPGVESWVHGLVWRHAVCPDVPDATTVRAGEVACTDCFLIHPTGVCDR